MLEDWRTAPVEPPVRAMLGFLEKLTRDPASVTSADVDPLREVGLTDNAIEDAIHVSALFHVYTRRQTRSSSISRRPRDLPKGR